MKKENGITLIALIITIIIMLILVGVTINFALNGGIIQKAKQAAAQSQLQADREALFSAVVGSLGLDGEVDFATLNSEVIKIGFTGTNGTYTSAAGNTFTVDKYGNITSSGESSGSGADLTYLKNTLEGQNILDVMEDPSGGTFTDPSITLDYATMLEMGGLSATEENNTIVYPILYKGKAYSLLITFDENAESEEQEMIITGVTENTSKNANADLNYLRTFIGKTVDQVATRESNNVVFDNSEISFSSQYSGTPTSLGNDMYMIFIEYKENDYSVGLIDPDGNASSIDDYVIFTVLEGIFDTSSLGGDTPTATD